MNTSQRLAGADVLSQESQGSVTRLVDLIIDPARAFRGIAHHAPWFAAFVTAVALRFASLVVFYRPSLTIGKLVAGVVFQIGTVAPPVVFGSLAVWVAAKVCGLRVRWRVLFSIVMHVYVAYTLATVAVASIAGAVLPDSAELDLRNPPFVSFAPLVPDAASGLARRLVAELDLRAAYAAVLLWLGLRGAAPDEPAAAATRAVATVVATRLATVAVVQLMR
jgi:hypothetical protein